ncbi:hypothetical protein [Mariniblastus fucicola]|uniref:Uncharacterized protein n=1 Tax=Mariniblastus fucicola TaxID=980251 RepID=A0A5B9PHR6_9BACT|nr:hypothetical protein [Mariniblastus fucicola]QEG24206.1 hypothetical protein MFFC18_41230 [Mariniblastus fucicola]
MNPVAQQFLTQEAILAYARDVDPAGNDQFAAQLRSVSADQLFDSSIADDELAQCCKSGLWLLHNFLHESHEISQSIHSAEGSWWHAIMHRTEGDFSNAKYWYRRAGEHQAFGDVTDGFDPYAFVDRCQQEYRNGSLSDDTQEIAFAEWKALFDYCYLNAA